MRSCTMICIIGTAHSKTQFWSNAIRRGESLDTCGTIVERFEYYLQDAAKALKATAICEENSAQLVDKMDGGMSVAKKVAEELGLQHIYCDPNQEERLSMGIQSQDREQIWLSRIQPLSPNETTIIFVCGADHSDTFRSLLEDSGLDAQICCQDWIQFEPTTF